MKTYYLYLKQSPLGLKYLGITTRDPYKYLGSGKYWRRHLKAHKFSALDVKTEIVFSSIIEKEVNTVALEYSEKFNIVESKDFANLMPESGMDCTLGRPCSEETKLKISESNKGRQPSKETVAKILKNRKSNKGFKHSEETKRKLSELRKGKTLSKETIEKMRAKTKGSRLKANFKKVHQYDLKGNYLKSFPSITDAIKECPYDIYNAASGRHSTAGGFQWRLYKQENIGVFSRTCKTVYQYCLNNILVKEWNGTKEPSRELNINRTSIRNCLSKLSKTAGKYKWTYVLCETCHNIKTQNEKTK
jgi:hypothetical protein